MTEIIRPEDSVYFRNWGIIPGAPRLTHSETASMDLSTVGRLPAHQWVIPAPSDWDLMEALLEIEGIFESAPPIDWGEVHDPVSPLIDSEIIEVEQPIQEIARISTPNLSVPRYLVFSTTTSK